MKILSFIGKKVLTVKDYVGNKYLAFTALVTTYAMQGTVAFADDPKPVTIKTDSVSDPLSMVGNFLGLLFDIFFMVGACLLAYAFYMLFNAQKDSDAESKSKALNFIVASIGIMSLRWVFSFLGITG